MTSADHITLALVLAAVIAVVVVCTKLVLPWTSRGFTLALLYELRDRLFLRAGDARDALMFQDAEFVLCMLLNLVRDRNEERLAGVLSSLSKRDGRATWRTAVYEREMAELDEESLRHILGAFLLAVVVVFVHLLTIRPSRIVRTALQVATFVPALAADAAGELGKQVSALADAVPRLETDRLATG